MAVYKKTLAVLFLAGNAFACYPHTNLMLCWDAQEGSGLQVADSAGSQFSENGIMTGAVAWVEGQSPRGLMSTRQSSNTFVNTGLNMVTFPGTDNVDIRTSGDASQFNFPGTQPFIIALTMAPASIRPAANGVLVQNAATGEGWTFYFDTSGHLVFLETGVAGRDFGFGNAKGCCLQDLNPHRVLVARRAGQYYLFLDGELYGDTTLSVGNINAGANVLGFGSNLVNLGNFVGKMNRLAIYSFDWKDFTYISAFAKNEYQYWQGVTPPMEEEEK